MKPFNFLTNQRRDNKSVKRWLIFSALLFILMLIIMSLISLRQIKLFAELKRKKANLYKNIHKHVKNIEKYHASRKSYVQYQKLVAQAQEPRIFPDTYLKRISEVIPLDTFLTNFSYSLHNKIRIEGKASSTRAITDFMKNLIGITDFKTVSLMQITAHQDLCDYEIMLTL